jgi:hypothetical protein
MDAEDWLKGAEKKLVIAQCTDRERVLFAAHQLYGTAANWWETYCNAQVNIDTITWNEFKARFRTHYVPRGTLKLKKKEFTDLKQGGMTVNECLNSFIQLSRYAPDDINTDEKKQGVFLNGLNDDMSFSGQSSGSNVRPHFSHPNQFFKPLQMNRPPMKVQVMHHQFPMQRPNFQAQRLSF